MQDARITKLSAPAGAEANPIAIPDGHYLIHYSQPEQALQELHNLREYYRRRPGENSEGTEIIRLLSDQIEGIRRQKDTGKATMLANRLAVIAMANEVMYSILQ